MVNWFSYRCQLCLDICCEESDTRSLIGLVYLRGRVTRVVKSATFRGRILVIVGILLVAVTLRSAVTVVPPVVPEISRDLPFDSLTIGLLGMLPTLAFAIFGFLTPFVLRWTSLEKLTILAMLVAVVGQVVRIFVPNTPLFLIFTVVALAGMGAGNVLLPPLVKHYFPDRVGLITALYVTVLSLGTALPAQFAVPVADSAGWQVSLVIWAGANFIAAVPWILVLLRGRAADARVDLDVVSTMAPDGSLSKTESVEDSSATAAVSDQKINVWRSPMAIGLTLMFGCTSLNTYAMFAWLPGILTDAGLSRLEAGSMLALFSILGLPMSLLIPLLASRMRNPFPIVLVLLLCFVTGYLGLWLSPASPTWLWVVFAGAGPATFPLSLLLINHRTRTKLGAGALSGFSQGVGYALACIGPLLFGLLHQATGNWASGFIFLFCTLAVLGFGAYFACKPVYLEDQQARA